MDVKMLVAPVTNANPELILVGTLFNHCALPQPSGALAVVRMNSLQPTKRAHCAFALSGKLLPARVDKETLPTRVRSPHHLGAGCYQRTVPGFTRAHGHFFLASLLHQHCQPRKRQPDGD